MIDFKFRTIHLVKLCLTAMSTADSLEETTVIIANTAPIVAKSCIGLEHAKTYTVTMY
jgi:hypothetical protein